VRANRSSQQGFEDWIVGRLPRIRVRLERNAAREQGRILRSSRARQQKQEEGKAPSFFRAAQPRSANAES
jgi:hypothetical protein